MGSFIPAGASSTSLVVGFAKRDASLLELLGFPASEVIELGPSERPRGSATHHGPVGSSVA